MPTGRSRRRGRTCSARASSASSPPTWTSNARARRVSESATSDPAGPVPRLVEPRDHDAAAAPPGVDEAPVTEVDPGVMKIVEEDDVAGLEPPPGDRRAVPELLRRVVRKRDAHVRVDVHHEAGAVEAGRARAAPRVPRAEMTLGNGHDSPGARPPGPNPRGRAPGDRLGHIIEGRQRLGAAEHRKQER